MVGMIKVLSIFGTRPEAIKMAPVIQELQKYPELIDSKICVTAQHRQMLDQVLGIFNLVPDVDLDLMQSNQSLTELTARALSGLSKVIADIGPDVVLVQGDTTTVLAGSLAAFYQQIPVGHVEAGLRTYDRYNPFPEEINRRLTDGLSTFYFAPTATAQTALLNEGIPLEQIYLTGNPVIDALKQTLQKEPPGEVTDLLKNIGDNRILLFTAHRRENFGVPLTNFCQAIQEIVRKYRDVSVIYPVHLNPNVRDVVFEHLGGQDRIHLIEPLPYISFVHLMKASYLILTDSGGIQEEAPALGTPVLVLRNVTERPEAVDSGTVKVIGTDTASIVMETGHLLEDQNVYQKMATGVSPYGDGYAAERIVNVLLDYFNGS